MKVKYAKDNLQRLVTDIGFTDGLGHDVIRAYRRRIQMIENAEDERDFYNLKSLHFEKLSGARSHQHSMRLNDQWRLIIEIEAGTPKNTIVVTSIEDYH